MDDQTVINELAEILSVDAARLTPDFSLSEVSWDSVAIMSVIALIDDRYDEAVSGRELAACTTIGDILLIIKRISSKRHSA